MMKPLIVAALLGASAAAAPALADGYGAVTQTCYAEAEANAYSGSKHGYRARYQEILRACQARQGVHHAPVVRQRLHVVRVPLPGCVPGAPKMYRGTLYCLN
jgi:hypothetical protein